MSIWSWAIVASPKDGRLFQALVEWHDDLKCYELITQAKDIGQKFITASYVSNVNPANEYNLCR
jgi:hypothetical protein